MEKALFVIGITGLFLIGCDDTIIEPRVHVVKGTVIDSLTRIPLGSVWVDTDSLAPHQEHTDSVGYYYMPVGYSAIYSIYCGKEGYMMTEREAAFPDKVNTVVIDFELVPEGK